MFLTKQMQTNIFELVVEMSARQEKVEARVDLIEKNLHLLQVGYYIIYISTAGIE